MPASADEYKISKIGIFGSTARGEANDESDVDIVICISEPDFFTLAGIKNDLEVRLKKSVDIVTYTDTMNSFCIHSRGMTLDGYRGVFFGRPSDRNGQEKKYPFGEFRAGVYVFFVLCSSHANKKAISRRNISVAAGTSTAIYCST